MVQKVIIINTENPSSNKSTSEAFPSKCLSKGRGDSFQDTHTCGGNVSRFAQKRSRGEWERNFSIMIKCRLAKWRQLLQNCRSHSLSETFSKMGNSPIASCRLSDSPKRHVGVKFSERLITNGLASFNERRKRQLKNCYLTLSKFCATVFENR